MEIILATSNPKKVKEMNAIMGGMDVRFRLLSEFPNAPEIIEDGLTFESNALKKARVIFQHTGMMTLADDSGIEVDALGGKPGVFSARYAGPGHDDRANLEKLLRDTEHVPDEKRIARFQCVIALVWSEGGDILEKTFLGVMEGVLLRAPRGVHGFGYDPIFGVPQYGKSAAELDPELKNKISHRGRALEQFKAFFDKEFSKIKINDIK